MAKQQEEEIVLTCEACGEHLHARVVSQQSKHQSAIELRTKAELFCPNCGKPKNLINQFKKHQHAKKIKGAQI